MFMVSTTTGTQGWAGERGQELKGDEMMKRAECQQEAEAAHPAPARGQWKRNASMKRKQMILMVMLMKINDINDIFQTMVWASMHVIVIVGIVVIVVIAVIVIGAIAVIVVIFVHTYACMLLLMMVALMFSHPCWPQPHETRVETDETMQLLLASAP